MIGCDDGNDHIIMIKLRSNNSSFDDIIIFRRIWHHHITSCTIYMLDVTQFKEGKYHYQLTSIGIKCIIFVSKYDGYQLHCVALYK